MCNGLIKENADAGRRDSCFNFLEPWEEIFRLNSATGPFLLFSSLLFLCVGLSECVLLPHGKQRVRSVAFQGRSVLHEMITFCKEQTFGRQAKPAGLPRQFIKISSFGL